MGGGVRGVTRRVDTHGVKGVGDLTFEALFLNHRKENMWDL